MAGLVVVLISDDGFAHGLRPDDGELLWSVRLAGTSAMPPIHHDGRLYLCADWDPGRGGVIYGIYPLTGRRVYRRIVPASFTGPPLIIDGMAVFALETPASFLIVAVDLEEGRLLWSHSLETAHIDTPTLTWDSASQTLVVKSDTGRCVGLELPTGDTRWELSLLDKGDILLTNVEPIPIDGHLVVPERYVSILDPVTGKRLHRLESLPEHSCFLHVDGDMRMILGDGQDHLECFDLSGFLALV